MDFYISQFNALSCSYLDVCDFRNAVSPTLIPSGVISFNLKLNDKKTTRNISSYLTLCQGVMSPIAASLQSILTEQLFSTAFICTQYLYVFRFTICAF